MFLKMLTFKQQMWRCLVLCVAIATGYDENGSLKVAVMVITQV